MGGVCYSLDEWKKVSTEQLGADPRVHIAGITRCQVGSFKIRVYAWHIWTVLQRMRSFPKQVVTSSKLEDPEPGTRNCRIAS